jgi:cob(I)alamin adenosyltransferase
MSRSGEKKIYTRGGDRGLTTLLSGEQVYKDDPRVWAYGDMDELNAQLGLSRALNTASLFQDRLSAIQVKLMAGSAELAMMPNRTSRLTKRIGPADIKKLETAIDELTGLFGRPTHFITAGRSPAGAALHVARTVCRRCERHVVALYRASGAYEHILAYLNRLGDLLFVMAWAREVLDVIDLVLSDMDVAGDGEEH